MTVVAVDACYTNPMVADTIVIGPGQTIDVLLTADQPLASYYMAAHSYDSLGMEYDKTTTRGVSRRRQLGSSVQRRVMVCGLRCVGVYAAPDKNRGWFPGSRRLQGRVFPTTKGC
ncbi:hypothetical protein C3L33_23397, partial [Rhododendron williamsianum]